MNSFCNAREKACRRWGRIHLVDKCLLIILSLLMLQSALNLFLNEVVNQETNVIDVVIRTSAAGIFGYLISANFDQQRKRKKQRKNAGQDAAVTETGTAPAPLQNRIGFESGEGNPSLQTPAAPQLIPEEGDFRANYDKSQVLIVAAVGIVSLVVLLIYRNFFPISPGSAGTLTQFRDFVSGSVGFLISCSTSATVAGKE